MSCTFLQSDKVSGFKRTAGAVAIDGYHRIGAAGMNLHKVTQRRRLVIPAGQQFVDIDLVALRGREVLPAIDAVAAGRVRAGLTDGKSAYRHRR
ncbi:hypothetical protein LFZ31_20885, partial [Salmonella enterica subsp. enterica serovar Newport str. S09097]